MKENWSKKSLTSHPWESHIFLNLGESPGRYQVSNWKQRRDNTHNATAQRSRCIYRKYCLGTWQIFFFGPVFKKCVFCRARLSPFGGGGNFFGKPGDLLHFQTFSKLLIHSPYIDFELNFISKFGQFQDIFLKNSSGNFHFEKITTKNVFEKPLRKCEFKKTSRRRISFEKFEKPLRKCVFQKKIEMRIFLRKTT